MMIYAAIVEHRHGTNLYLGECEYDLNCQLRGYVWDYWKEARAFAPALPEEPPLAAPDAIAAYFDTMAEHGGDEFLTRFDPQAVPVAAEAPRARVVVGLEGGIVQGASANVPGIEVLVVDYDTDGADADRVREIPQERGADVEAYTYAFDADNAPAWVDSVAAVVLA